VFRTEAFVVNASVWVVGYPAGSSGLLASIVASWGSIWVVGGMCVVWTAGSVVVRTWPPATWDEPSAGSSWYCQGEWNMSNHELL
jgi:hypothetical protein